MNHSLRRGVRERSTNSGSVGDWLTELLYLFEVEILLYQPGILRGKFLLVKLTDRDVLVSVDGCVVHSVHVPWVICGREVLWC